MWGKGYVGPPLKLLGGPWPPTPPPALPTPMCRPCQVAENIFSKFKFNRANCISELNESHALRI